MNLLRKYIREVISEDLGRQVWADRANADSRHFGTEPDTQREEDLWASVYGYLVSDMGTAITSADVQDITRYAQDPRYSDVFIPYTGAAPLYRGQQLPRELLDGLLGSDWPGLPSEVQKTHFKSSVRDELILSDPVPIDFVYSPEEFHREGIASSWTPNYLIAMDFATDTYKAKGHDWVATVLVTDSSGGDFLDIGPLYNYWRLDAHEHEEEVMGLGPIRVKAIRVEV
ncbi:MAG TPA: hypothetical protein EYG51_26075 [Pseudomonadales bacterium]|nr:hypothetical protein [Pseudomonadales bacterium]